MPKPKQKYRIEENKYMQEKSQIDKRR